MISHPASDKPVLFISDLHLDPVRPKVTQLFIEFLASADAAAVYILGDLFEAWVGDDMVTGDEPEFAAMRALQDRGIPLYVMRGNRDFLLGERFAELAGAELLPDPTVIDLHGERTLLMHGDSLCTDDTKHQEFRAMVHDPNWQATFLQMPLDDRLALARTVRQESTNRNAALADYLMDVNEGAVAEAMREQGVRTLIHGHTHRPAVHEFSLDGAPARRIVLGDWYEQGSQLYCLRDDRKLLNMPLPADD